MSLKHYGVLRGRVLAAKREDDKLQPALSDAGGSGRDDYRLAVNVMSQLSPSELLFIVIEDFQHPLTQKLPALAEGFTALPKQPDTAALDFIRGNLFNRLDMRLLPPSLPGDDNDLSDRLAHYVDRAASEADARASTPSASAGGRSRASPTRSSASSPGNGVHDIHMNQGNDAGHRGDDGVWQDGGLILRFPATDQWVAIFLAFQSQAWHTDDVTGHTLPGPTRARADAAPERARLPGPHRRRAGQPGRARRRGRNRHAAQRDARRDRPRRLAADRQGRADAGARRADRGRRDACRWRSAPPLALGNKGGMITLVDADRPQGRRRRLHQGAGRGRGLDDRVLSDLRNRVRL